MLFTFIKNLDLISEQIERLFPDEFFGIIQTGSKIEPQIGKLNETGECVLRELTLSEQADIQAILDIDYFQKIIDNIRQSIRTQAEDTFYRLALEKTGEPINALIIQEWQLKELLAKNWIAAGKPEPLPDNDFTLAYYEAAGDPEKTPSELMESWTINAANWRGLNVVYISWRQGFRARVKAAATEAELESLRVAIEVELRGLLGM